MIRNGLKRGFTGIGWATLGAFIALSLNTMLGFVGLSPVAQQQGFVVPQLLVPSGINARPQLIESDGNLYLVGARPFSNPIKFFMGPDLDHGLYQFVQEEPDGSLFTGMETFRRPDSTRPVSDGYGAYSLRVWGNNILIERNGVIVGRELVVSKIILQEPAATAGGGMTWDPTDLGTYVTRDGPDLVVFHNGREIARLR